MEFTIIYFSGTGNTELISREIKKRLEQKEHFVELISLEDIKKDKKKISKITFENKIIGFGFPVYKFTFPDIFLNFFPLFNRFASNNKYFMFSSFARFTAESFYEFSKKLKKKKFHLIAEESFKSPSCGISARKPETDFEYENVMFFEDDIHIKLDNFVENVLSSVDNKNIKISHKHHILNPLRLKIVKDIERTKYPKLQINQDSCSLCGVCASKCPDDNLVNRKTHIEIKDKYHCLHCLRCMNHCSSNAIIFGRLTIGKNRYTMKLRNQLYEKATSGYREKYWPDFESIRLKWRKRTIQYWWKHRKNPEI